MPTNPLSSSSTSNSVQHCCAYCHVRDYGFKRCARCKIVHYCSIKCQTKHWNFVHKKQCKIWKRIYHNKTLTEQELEKLDGDVVLKYAHLGDTHEGPLINAFKDMMQERVRKSQKDRTEEQILSDDNEHSLMVNAVVSEILDAFDRDGDRRLNYREWNSMIRELGFRECTTTKEFFYEIANNELLPEYLPSLSNGCYGSFLYPDARVQEITFGSSEIVETMRYCAYIMSTSPQIVDEDFREKYDFCSEESYIKAFTLMFKLQPHAQAICCLGETPARDFFEAVLDAVPCLTDDIVSIIYSFASLAGQYIMKISWHRLRWMSILEDQEGMWEAYQKDMYYDICYILKRDENGYRDIFVNFEICDDVDKCNEKLDRLNAGSRFSFYNFRSINMEEETEEKKKWCLGVVAAYVPDQSFSYKEHAILIGKMLKFHGLNPKLCHYIYVGTRFKMAREEKHQIVVEFNKKYKSNTKYRPHEPKRPMLFDF